MFSQERHIILRPIELSSHNAEITTLMATEQGPNLGNLCKSVEDNFSLKLSRKLLNSFLSLFD